MKIPKAFFLPNPPNCDTRPRARSWRATLLTALLGAGAGAALTFSAAAQQIITGPSDPQVDFFNPAGTFVLAEYYGGWNAGPLTIGAATFLQNSGRVPNSEGTEQNTPNFGASPEQKAFAYFSDSAKYQSSGGLQSFTVPTVVGRNYKAQFFYHDNNYNAAGKRVFCVTNNGVALTPSMDLVALGAYTTNAVDVLLTNYFTATSDTMLYQAQRAPGGADNALLCAMTLEDVSPAPYIYTQPVSAAAYDGNTVQLSVLAAGTNLTYQWQSSPAGAGTFTSLVDGGTVSGATTATLTIRNIAASTDYQVLIGNAAGQLISATASISVSTSLPQITGDLPAAPTAYAANTFTLPVTVSGSGPFTFTWSKNGSPLSDGGRISGAHTATLTLSNVQSADAGSYQLHIVNPYGTADSVAAAVSVSSAIGIYDGSTWTTNGIAVIKDNVLTVTDGRNNVGSSAFFNWPVNVDAFTASFVYQDVSGGGADGIAFVLQNSVLGPAALGGIGGSIGYGSPGTIGPSVAITLGVYNNEGTCVRTGSSPGGFTGTVPNTMLASGDPILVTLSYWGGVLTITLLDQYTQDTFTTYYVVDIPTALGYPGPTGGGAVHTAYIGFTGGSGGLSAIQTVRDFSYVLNPPGGNPQVITNWDDPKLDLQGNAQGHFALAEYYSRADFNVGPLQLGNATFVQNTTRLAACGFYDVVQNRPNFGASTQQTNLAWISGGCAVFNAGNPPAAFTIPTLPGHNYKLQMLFHDNWYNGDRNARRWDVVVGDVTNVVGLSAAALGSYRTQTRDVLLTNSFTATDTSLPIQFYNRADAGVLSALTLVDYTSTPGIYTQPVNQSAFNGNSAQFFISAGGEGPLSYQWQGRAAGIGEFTNLVDSAQISGSTSNVLTLLNVPLQNMEYQVVVSNPYGHLTSASATLTVTTSAPLPSVPEVRPNPLTWPTNYPFSLAATVEGSLPMTFEWRHNGTALADGGRVSGAHTPVLSIANAQAGDAGTYQLFINNAYGNAASTVATVTMVSGVGVADGSAWTLNGAHGNGSLDPAQVTATDTLQVSDGTGDVAQSAFFNAPVNVDAFRVSYVYQDLYGGGADGAAFVLHNDPRGPAALGGGGGWLGYSAGNNRPAIAPSVALEFSIWGTGGMALQTQGASGTYVPPTPISFGSADPISVTIQYSAGVFAVNLTNLNNPSLTYSMAYNLDVAKAVGGHTAYIGFCGASGGATAFQTISHFTYGPIPVSPPIFLKDLSTIPFSAQQGCPIPFATVVGGTEPLHYQWQFNSANLANGGRLEGANSNHLTVHYAQPEDAGVYQLVVNNYYGSATSSLATVTTVVSNRFGFDVADAWSLNAGTVPYSLTALLLTDGGGNEARSAFLATPVSVEGFQASFVYQDLDSGAADGFAFVLQNSAYGPTAVGGAGGQLGYTGIAPSAALEFNLFSYGSPALALNTNGAVGGYQSIAPLDLHTNPITVTLVYQTGNLSVTLTDQVTSETFHTNYSIDLPAAVGGSTAYVGFTAGTGVFTSMQQISDFTFLGLPTLAIQRAGSTGAILSWPEGIGVYSLFTEGALGAANWTSLPLPAYGVTNGRVQVPIGPLNGQRFYRLGTSTP